MIVALILSVAMAGAPPPNVIPWDSVWIDERQPRDTTGVATGRWVHFIVRDKYELAMFGKTKKDLADVKADIAILKELLEKEMAAAEAESK